MDLNGLVRFAAVVERGGFSAAARTLGVPRQALHRSVSALEATAGVQLLERSGSRVRVTDAGERLAKHAATILSEARAAHANLAAARRRPRGRLRITAPHLFAEEFLSLPIQDFLAAWPDVEVDADLTTARRDLSRHDLDLAIRLGPRPTEAGYVVQLGSLSQACVAAPSYLAKAAPLLEPRDLPQHAVIVYGAARGSYQLRVDSARIALSACRAAIGVAWLPELMCADDVVSGTLSTVLAPWRCPKATVWAFSSTPIARSPTLRAFVDLVRARMPKNG
jgi:DNA-binding transcriptional LysR family regulator